MKTTGSIRKAKAGGKGGKDSKGGKGQAGTVAVALV